MWNEYVALDNEACIAYHVWNILVTEWGLAKDRTAHWSAFGLFKCFTQHFPLPRMVSPLIGVQRQSMCII